jgi:hypothetical protein
MRRGLFAAAVLHVPVHDSASSTAATGVRTTIFDHSIRNEPAALDGAAASGDEDEIGRHDEPGWHAGGVTAQACATTL